MEPFLYLNSKKGNSVEAAQNPYLLHLVPKADESHKKVPYWVTRTAGNNL